MSGAVTGGFADELPGSTSFDAGHDLHGLNHLADVELFRRDQTRVIYSATDLRLERRVSVQVLNPMAAAAHRSNFERQSKILGHLSAHPNVVTVYETGFLAGDRPFWVTEPLHGRNLATVLAEEGPMPWQTAADVVVQLCDALGQAHRAGALHRQLCPDTVLMTGMTPKLAEFSGPLDDSIGGQLSSGPAALHRAPETLDNIWDERTDLYSLASILYEMVDGTAPFWRPGDDSPEAIRLRLMHESPPPLDPTQVPPALSVFVAAALSKDPFDRPQSAQEFGDELLLIRQNRTTGSTPSVLHGTTGALPITAIDTVVEARADAYHYPPPPAPVAAQTSINRPAPEHGHTSVYSGLIAEPAPLTPSDNFVPTAPHQPRRPTSFLVAMTMIAVGLVGLLAVVAFSAFGSEDGQAAAPVLPDPDAQTVIEATTDGVATPSSTPMEDESAAMAEEMTETTATTAQPMGSTASTVPRVAVPNMVGSRIEDATLALSQSGFEVVVVGRKSTTATPGFVTQQVPTAGIEVVQPFTVTLYIPRVSVLPAMIGRPADTVCLELQALSLSCARTAQYNDQVPVGLVIATTPEAGASFDDGSTVEVFVSRGPVTTVTVPDVAGRSKDQAEAALLTAGFTAISFDTRSSETVPVDTAVGSTPAADTPLATDQPITVLLSSGPAATVTVPELIGASQADAESRLSAAGLTATVTFEDLPAGDADIGLVVSASRAAGEAVDSGSAVAITVGREEAQSTSSTTAAPATTTTTSAG